MIPLKTTHQAFVMLAATLLLSTCVLCDTVWEPLKPGLGYARGKPCGRDVCSGYYARGDVCAAVAKGYTTICGGNGGSYRVNPGCLKPSDDLSPPPPIFAAPHPDFSDLVTLPEPPIYHPRPSRTFYSCVPNEEWAAAKYKCYEGLNGSDCEFQSWERNCGDMHLYPYIGKVRASVAEERGITTDGRKATRISAMTSRSAYTDVHTPTDYSDFGMEDIWDTTSDALELFDIGFDISGLSVLSWFVKFFSAKEKADYLDKIDNAWASNFGSQSCNILDSGNLSQSVVYSEGDGLVTLSRERKPSRPGHPASHEYWTKVRAADEYALSIVCEAPTKVVYQAETQWFGPISEFRFPSSYRGTCTVAVLSKDVREVTYDYGGDCVNRCNNNGPAPTRCYKLKPGKTINIYMRNDAATSTSLCVSDLVRYNAIKVKELGSLIVRAVKLLV